RYFPREVCRQALRVIDAEHFVRRRAAKITINYQHRRTHLSERYRGVDDGRSLAFTGLSAGDEYRLGRPPGSRQQHRCSKNAISLSRRRLIIERRQLERGLGFSVSGAAISEYFSTLRR